MQLVRVFLSAILSFFNLNQSPVKPTPPLISPTPVIEPISLEKILNGQPDFPQNAGVISIITTGDIIPARTVNYKMTLSNDFTLPFQKTADTLQNADLTVINLEAPLITDCPVTTDGMIFCGNPRFTEGMLYAGIDVATMGNNHSLNHGWAGLSETMEILTKNDIIYAGPDQIRLSGLATKKVKGMTFGILAYNVLDNPEKQKILAEIRAAKMKNDFLITAFHWGAEYLRFPAAETKQLAHEAIDNGADLITGNHPHWIQPIEVYKDKLIIYAHGNFIFDQEWSEDTKTGIIVKTYMSGGKIADAEIIPIYISDYNQPEILDGEKKEEILNLVRDISIN